MNAYIIDDEDAPRLILKHLLGRIDPSITILGEANNLQDGVEELKNLEVDVLFLDIEMPKHKGLEIDQFLQGPLNFEIVFVTAYSQYAIEAFKLSAFDYLLKPLNQADLEATIQRLKLKKEYFNDRLNGLEVLRNNLRESKEQQYLLRTHKEELVIQVNEIVSLEADGMYTHIVLLNERITASRPLKEILADLPDCFFRTHRSYAVNLHNVSIPVRISGEGVKTSVGYVPLSGRNKQSFIERMKSVE